jgi:hypothetical protein
MQKELLITLPIATSLFILTVIFKPAFFVVTLFIVLIWFVLARGNGYPVLAYLALALSIGLFLGFYPKDQSDPTVSFENQAKSLAASQFNTPKLSVSELSGSRGADGIYLVAPNQENINKVVLVRPSQKETQTYLISDVNRQLKESGQENISQYTLGSQAQERLMLGQFGEKYPLRYAFAFLLSLLPLVLVASLPSRRKSGETRTFDTLDGKLKSWFLPSGPSQDARAVTGSAPIQMILVVLIIFLIGSMPY